MQDYLKHELRWSDPSGIDDRITWFDGRKRNSGGNFVYWAACELFFEDFRLGVGVVVVFVRFVRLFASWGSRWEGDVSVLMKAYI